MIPGELKTKHRTKFFRNQDLVQLQTDVNCWLDINERLPGFQFGVVKKNLLPKSVEDSMYVYEISYICSGRTSLDMHWYLGLTVGPAFFDPCSKGIRPSWEKESAEAKMKLMVKMKKIQANQNS